MPEIGGVKFAVGQANNNENRRYIHTHHIGGDKRDSSSLNLKVLCIDCHYKIHQSLAGNHEHSKFLEIKQQLNLAETDKQKQQQQLEIASKNTVTIGKLMFQDSELPARMNWQSACDYCKKLRLLGFSNWRLPNKDELKIAYRNKSKFNNIRNEWYWSISKYTSSYFWIVYFVSGDVLWNSQASSDLVLCVRDLN